MEEVTVTRDDYDALPYPSHAYAFTHPDVMAVEAGLRGLAPAPVGQARVLELGCASGGNLLPIAAALPGSRCVGVDLSPVQIEEGQRIIAELGLPNIELIAADLTQLGDEIGEFDYVIAHGLYSWVPPPVREGTLRLLQRHLAPDGVAFLSFNAYPGFHKREHLREMMRYHTAAIEGREEAAMQGRALLEFLLANARDKNDENAHLLKAELRNTRELSRSYFFHDLLGPYNNAFYFHEFVADTARYDLQFLAEAPGKGVVASLSETAQNALAGLGDDVIRREQYIDFLFNTSFRRALVCRADRPVSRAIPHDRIRSLFVNSLAVPTKPVTPGSAEPITFTSRYGGTATVEHPGFRSLLLALHQSRPAALDFTELHAAIAAQGVNLDPAELPEMVLSGHDGGLLELKQRRAVTVTIASDRPRISPLARLQARRGIDVVNLRHRPLVIDPIERALLARLDGAHDAADLAREVNVEIEAGRLKLPAEAGKGTVEWVQQFVARALRRFAQDSMYEG